jgi:Cu/Ag efflux pump CusA
MGAVIRTSLRFRLLFLAVAAGVLALGVAQLRGAPVDALPEFTPPYTEIQTEALGLSATEVENLITVPLEADLLNGVEGVDVIRSQSLPGLSSIVLVFEPDTDVYRARQLVQERLAQAHALPRVSKPPTLLQPLSSSSRVLMVGISSDELSPIEESIIARWTLRPRLMGVPGVANVAIWGMRDQQIQVLVDPDDLRDRGVRLDQVVKTAANAQIVSPLSFVEASTPGSGGFIETPQQRLQVRNVLDRLADPAQLGKVPVEGTRSRLQLSRVADVTIGHQPLIGDAVVRDGEGLLLVVEKFPGANAGAVTRGIEQELEILRPGLSGMRTDTSVFRPADYVEEALDNLALALAIGAALLALALAALLFQWRTVLVALVALPVSLMAAALVLDALGETFNGISFAGLAAAMALVVDDAVAGAHNVARRLREAGGVAEARANVVLAASREVRGPLAYGTLIALIAIAPLAVMEGRPGAFFAPLALAYALAVLAATAVALTITPALSLLLFSHGTPVQRESPLLRRVRHWYAAALRRGLLRPRAVIVAAAVGVVVAVAALPLLGAPLIPSFDDRHVLVRLTSEPGTSNPRMRETAAAVSRELRGLPDVENVGAHVGRAITGDQRVDVNSGEVWVSLAAGADRGAAIDDIQAVVGRFAGVDGDVATYTEQMIRDVGALGDGDGGGEGLSVLTGSDSPLVTRVYGHDLPALHREAEKVRRLLSGIDGVVRPRVKAPESQPNLVIEVDLVRARRFGIKPGDVRRAEATLLQGIQVGSVFEDQKVFDVVVQGALHTRRSMADVRNLLIDRPGGGHVRLRQVADVRIEPTPVAIRREAVSRYVDVVAGVEGRSVAAVAEAARDRLADVRFPLEYHAEVLEQTTGEEIGAMTMLAFAAVAALGAFLLLQAAFRSWLLAVMALLLLPVALVGGVGGALAGGAELSLGSLAAFLALLGLAARTTVLSIREFQDLEWVRGEPLGPALVQRGAQQRLVPVLTSACALAAVAAPFAVLGPRAGLEVLHPMAVVILGGLLTTTTTALLVLPVLYSRFAVATQRPMLDADGVLVQQWTGDEIAPAAPAPAHGNRGRLGGLDQPQAGAPRPAERER